MTDKKYKSIDVSDGLKVMFTATDGEKKSIFIADASTHLTD